MHDKLDEIIGRLDKFERLHATNNRRLTRIERGQAVIAHKLDIDIQLGAAGLSLEIQNMTTAAELKALSEEILVTAQANTDATSAVAGALNSVIALYVQALADLAAAQATSDPASIEAAMANLTAIKGLIDTDTLAENALANTTIPTP